MVTTGEVDERLMTTEDGVGQEPSAEACDESDDVEDGSGYLIA